MKRNPISILNSKFTYVILHLLKVKHNIPCQCRIVHINIYSSSKYNIKGRKQQGI